MPKYLIAYAVHVLTLLVAIAAVALCLWWTVTGRLNLAVFVGAALVALFLGSGRIVQGLEAVEHWADAKHPNAPQ